MKISQANLEGQVILHDAASHEWLLFRDPHQIIIANRPMEVVEAIKFIERLVLDRGCYAAGFLSYESSGAFDAALLSHANQDFPLLWFGIYSKPCSYVLPKPDFDAYRLEEPVPTISQADYNRAIARIKAYIQSGDTYQVNYTLRLRSRFHGDPFQLFLAMVAAQSPGFSAWIDTGRYAVCSASPELFFRLDGAALTCKPMKGTVGRGRTKEEDLAHAEWLRNSEKNRAENLMIVDMIRNDLGRVAEVGSVHVPRMYEVERHPTLWQMTSTVAATCRRSFAEIMAALFPCASITGAPKIRTTQIIAELEPEARGLYTGSIGFLAPGRRAQFSVAIRTAVVDRQTELVQYGSGGGIVWDSVREDEFREALLKARVLTERRPEFLLLETFLWTSEESYFLMDYHLRRLADSADYFGYEVHIDNVREQMIARIPDFRGASMRVRLLVASDGRPNIQAEPLDEPEENRPLRICLAPNPVNSTDIFLYHKTTCRRAYEEARQACPDYDDVLLWNEREEITESSVANVVARIGSDLFTPPRDSGLLAGTFREWLLNTGRIKERVLRIPDLQKCSKIFLINSVRKWQEAILYSTGEGQI